MRCQGGRGCPQIFGLLPFAKNTGLFKKLPKHRRVSKTVVSDVCPTTYLYLGQMSNSALQLILTISIITITSACFDQCLTKMLRVPDYHKLPCEQTLVRNEIF